MPTKRHYGPPDSTQPRHFGEPVPDLSGGVLLIASIAGSWLAVYGLYLMFL